MWKLHDWLEARALSNQPSHVQDYSMFMVALHLAARRGEIFRIKPDDLDFSQDQVRLWTRKRKGGAMECGWLPMTKELRSVLLRWLEIRMAMPGIVADTIFVCVDKTAFCDEHYGKSFTARAHVMKRWSEAVSIEPFGWHGVRHLTASILFNKGYPTAHIQAIFGHKSPHTTDLYLRKLGLKHLKTALEEGLKREARGNLFSSEKAVCIRVEGWDHFAPSFCTQHKIKRGCLRNPLI